MKVLPRRSKYRPNHKVVAFVFFVMMAMLIWTQYSVLKISMKKYRKKLERAKMFVKLSAGPPEMLDALPFDPLASFERPSHIVSKGTVMGTITSTGNMQKQYYKLENVQIGKGGLYFYYDEGFQKPETNWVDTIFNNGTSMKLPTMTMMRHAENGKYTYMPWHYNPASKKQPDCKTWVNRPTYLVQMQHSSNIWHAWNEGIMAAFQSLREQGLLPLVEVDADGNQKEYVDDLDSGCPWEIDQETLEPKRMASCREKTGFIPHGPCAANETHDCSPGVHSYFKANGPLLWMAKDMGVTKSWAHMYNAISENIWPWKSLVGSCFREIYIGKSNVLSYYMPLYTQSEFTGAQERIQEVTRWRSNATEAFKQLMRPAQKNAISIQRNVDKIPLWKEPWPKYDDPEWDRLRMGIGPEDMDALDTVLPKKEWAGRAYMSPKEIKGLGRLWNRSAKLTRSLATRDTREQNKNTKAPKDGGLRLERPRPVVTYLWRDNYKRSVLNTHDLLSYILLRYNVTLKVTTLQEPLPEVIDLLSNSDVVFGMHGAGWTNGLFIKRGAASLQLIPYGWIKEDGSSIRGSSYKSLLLASDSMYSEWVNENPEYAYIRRHDFKSLKMKGIHMDYALHPIPKWGMPEGVRPGNHWIYQNTFVDMESFAPILDATMQQAGIKATLSNDDAHF